MGIKAGKIWGTTELVFSNSVLEYHRLEFNKGFSCSEHIHEFKCNGFFVESGVMLIRTWNTNGSVDETILRAGDSTEVLPNIFHQFVGIETGVAFELYWAPFVHDDIVRRTVGVKVK